MIPQQKLPSLEEALSGTLYGSAKPDEKHIVMIDPSGLTEIEDQPFRPYSPEKLSELAADIRRMGRSIPAPSERKAASILSLPGATGNGLENLQA